MWILRSAKKLSSWDAVWVEGAARRCTYPGAVLHALGVAPHGMRWWAVLDWPGWRVPPSNGLRCYIECFPDAILLCKHK